MAQIRYADRLYIKLVYAIGGGTVDPVYHAKLFLKAVQFVLAGKDELESSTRAETHPLGWNV